MTYIPKPVVAHQRVDDTRLVHRTDGPRRSVRRQQQRLGLNRCGHRLEHRRDRGRAFGLPACDPLEAINDFETTALAGDDPDREIGKWRAPSRHAGLGRSPQRRKVEPQLIESERDDTSIHAAGGGRR